MTKVREGVSPISATPKFTAETQWRREIGYGWEIKICHVRAQFISGAAWRTAEGKLPGGWA